MFNLLAVLSTEAIRDELKDRLKMKGNIFKQSAESEKRVKLEKLRKKLEDKTDENETEIGKDVTKNETKIKTPRKWIKKSKYKRIQKKLKKQKVSVVFNYSSIELTPAMETLLNRGLNFAITPLKLNITQVLVDFRKFERTMLWQEFWSNKEKIQLKPQIFKQNKTNLPTKHPTPPGLKMFLNAAKSEIMDPHPHQK